MKWLENWARDLDPYFTIFGLLLGVLGIAFGFYFYFKTKQSKKISISSKTFRIAAHSNKFKKLKFLYDGHEIQQLLGTSIAFWNSGNVTIDKNDVVPLSPVEISLDGEGKIYDIELVAVSSDSNNFQIIPKELNSYIVTFDYIDKNEGCVIRILYSDNIQLDGKIKGVKGFSQMPNYRLKRFTKEKLLGSVWISNHFEVFMISVFLIASIISLIITKKIVTLFSIIPFSFLLIVYIFKSKKLPNELHDSFLDS